MNTMRVLYLLLVSQVNAQLQCHQHMFSATVGQTINVACTYDTKYRFSKKYLCLGESRSTCEILMDTDGFMKAEYRSRARITDAVYRGLYRGLHVQMTGLQLSDTGIYWVGIDKIYADIMFMIQVKVTEVNAQLQCHQHMFSATVGQTINVACTYDTKYRFSKKYLCLGESRSTCEILMDTDGFMKAEYRSRARITDAVYRGLYRGLHVQMTGLQLSDTGIYWVGIDKIYADIMFMIQVKVTEEAVSRPHVRPVGSPLLTCKGQPLTLTCRSERGTNAQYSWYRRNYSEAELLQSVPNLHLDCAFLTQDAVFVCSAHNTISRQFSEDVFCQVLQPGHENCVYSLTSEAVDSYDCRTTTLTPTTTAMTTVEVSSFETQTGGYENITLHANETLVDFLLRSWSGVPLWYDVIRWTLFVTMIIPIAVVHTCTWIRSSEHRDSHKHHKCG
ncbi:uncharacterized protein [Hoplias malabaricus]|uniref:uncharacterized protein n=1 Tax=Hoplias malabaricus TaxID=27720 RepID=UPI00346210BB